MIYYALGGGLGHLMRARKMVALLRLNSVRVLTASPEATALFDHADLSLLPAQWAAEPERVQPYILALLLALPPQERVLLVDSFPVGLLAELDIPALRTVAQVTYVARYVHWPAYMKRASALPAFDQVFIVDQLHPQQRDYLNKLHAPVRELVLPAVLPSTQAAPYRLEAGSWLIIHSGPQDELDMLVEYAEDLAQVKGASPMLVVASQVKSSHSVSQYIQDVPHNIDLSSADIILSGCGYHCMQELFPFHEKHHFIPFPRKYDDQFIRAKMYREKVISEKMMREKSLDGIAPANRSEVHGNV